MMARERFAELYKQSQSWLFDAALPLWAGQGIDPAGGFFEKLDQTGRPLEAPRRTRVIARQIYVFAAAGRMGWQGDGAALIAHGLDALYRGGVGTDGLIMATSLADGTPVDTRYDFYDHAFALFALANAATMLPHRKRALATAHALQDAMEAKYCHPVAGYREDRSTTSILRANPHMHMFEACLALAGVDEDARWRQIADAIGQLALDRFIDHETNALYEVFGPDWQALGEAEGQTIEPGHQFEWAWLLSAWTGGQHGQVRQAADRLVEVGLKGVGSAGHVIDELRSDLSPRSRTARTWPQCERVKCHVEWALTARDPRQSDRWWNEAVSALQSWAPFLDTPLSGLWFDRLTADNVPVTDPAPASTLYHVVCALETAQAALNGRGAAATLGLAKG